MLFTTNKKPDALMNTTCLDDCCRILEDKMEYSTDQLLVLLVRTQHLSRSVSMTLAFRNPKDSLPLSIIIQSFQHEIRQLRKTIPEHLIECSQFIVPGVGLISDILLIIGKQYRYAENSAIHCRNPFVRDRAQRRSIRWSDPDGPSGTTVGMPERNKIHARSPLREEEV